MVSTARPMAMTRTLRLSIAKLMTVPRLPGQSGLCGRTARSPVVLQVCQHGHASASLPVTETPPRQWTVS
jgi:hypothetical protein